MLKPFSKKALCDAKLKLTYSIGLCLSLVSCASVSLEESERAKIDLIGMSKDTLMQCAGVPDKTGKSDSGREYLAYTSEKLVQVPSDYPGPAFYPYFGHVGHRSHFRNSFVFYNTQQSRSETRNCTATFGLENDKVTSLSYNLNDSDHYGMRQCYQIVKNCLPTLKKK